jgi:hypothetical protein
LRETCLECVYKHIADAYIAEMEYHMGYEGENGPLVVGNLSHAAQEAAKDLPELASALRKFRLTWFNDRTTQIPYAELCGYVDACISAEKKSPERCPEYPDFHEWMSDVLDDSSH